MRRRGGGHALRDCAEQGHRSSENPSDSALCLLPPPSSPLVATGLQGADRVGGELEVGLALSQKRGCHLVGLGRLEKGEREMCFHGPQGATETRIESEGSSDDEGIGRASERAYWGRYVGGPNSMQKGEYYIRLFV